jgi:hypothetical protein
LQAEALQAGTPDDFCARIAKITKQRGAKAILDTSGAALAAAVDEGGVAAQYASALGKTANCQTLVSLTLARGEVPVMVALRLFLPHNWTSDVSRLKRARVPVEYRTPRSKPEIAVAEIDRAIAANLRFGCVLADAGYGLSAPFRQGLTARARLCHPFESSVWPHKLLLKRPRFKRNACSGGIV